MAVDLGGLVSGRVQTQKVAGEYLGRSQNRGHDHTEVHKRNEEGDRALFLTPDETDVYVRKEVPRWTALLKAAGIQPE